ncbi:MAG: hypothetical protein ACOYL6_14380 [Bacteriovoracaceae bacterium]
MKILLMTLLSSVFFSANSTYANQSYNLAYECKTLGKSTLAKTVSIFTDFSEGETENAPALVVLSDGQSAKAIQGQITLQGKPTPLTQAWIRVDGNLFGYTSKDLAISIDLSKPRRVSMFKKANARIGLVLSGSTDATNLENLSCNPMF